MSSNEDLKVGFQDSSATTADISESSTVAIVNVGQLQLRKIEAPTEGCLALHLVMIAYLNSPAFKRLSASFRHRISSAIGLFFSFLHYFKSDEDVPLDCINAYVQHLRSNPKFTHSFIHSSTLLLKRCLSWCDNESSLLSDHIKSLSRQYHIYAPNITPPEKTPNPSLSGLFSECPYNDTQLLDSLKKLSLWIINYEDHLRSEALQIDGILELIEGIGFMNVYKCPISYASFHYENASRDEARILYGAIVTKVRDSKNLVLKERLVADIQHPFEEESLNEEQLNWILDNCLMNATDGELPKCRVTYEIRQDGNRKLYQVGFKSLSIRSLLLPTDIECFSMQCLLACEKMNSSSIDNLTLDDVVKTPQGIQFQFQKLRRPTKDQVNITPLHALGSTIGKTYSRYIDAKKAKNNYFNASDQIKLLSYLVKATKDGTLGAKRFGQVSTRYIELLLTENTHLRRELLQAFEENAEELEPIFWLLGKIVEQNKKVSAQQAEYDRTRRRNKSLKRDEFVTESYIGLNIDYIRQSAIISENVKLFNSPHLFNDLNVIAQSANHSPTIHNEVYIDRSTAKEKVESDRLFVSRIGALMEQDAKLMGNLFEETSVLDYNQALEELGLARTDEGAHERISQRIDELGIDIDLMDSFKANGKKIFLANKVTIALIIKYLEHIRANFDNVLNDDSPQLTKATLAVRDYFYFSAVLQKFPEVVRKQGERYVNSLSFSYAKLSDIAGISNNG